MANVCKYKIKVTGTKKSCLALINMMPLYCGEKEILSFTGNDDNFALTFSGDCKWSVDAYTTRHDDIRKLAEDEVEQICDGMYWDYPLIEKSLMLNCDIWCISADIDDRVWPYYEHYACGDNVGGTKPTDLSLIPGLDYYQSGTISWDNFGTRLCKVKTHYDEKWYAGYNDIGDVVYVSKHGAMDPGRVTETANLGEYKASGCIIGCIGHVDDFITKDVERIWKGKKPCERIEYLKKLGFWEDNVKKAQFLKWASEKWTIYGLSHTWQEFVNELNNGTKTLMDQSNYLTASQLLDVDFK